MSIRDICFLNEIQIFLLLERFLRTDFAEGTENLEKLFDCQSENLKFDVEKTKATEDCLFILSTYAH